FLKIYRDRLTKKNYLSSQEPIFKFLFFSVLLHIFYDCFKLHLMEGCLMEKLQVGRATLTWLNGGVNFLDGGAMFGVVPKALWSKKYPYTDDNLIELRTDPILLQLDGENLLIDSGMGNDKLTDKQIRNFGVKEESSIEKSLEKMNLDIEDIDKILMTHLHF